VEVAGPRWVTFLQQEEEQCRPTSIDEVDSCAGTQ